MSVVLDQVGEFLVKILWITLLLLLDLQLHLVLLVLLFKFLLEPKKEFQFEEFAEQFLKKCQNLEKQPLISLISMNLT